MLDLVQRLNFGKLTKIEVGKVVSFWVYKRFIEPGS